MAPNRPRIHNENLLWMLDAQTRTQAARLGPAEGLHRESQPPKPGGVTALRRGSKEAWGLREGNLSVERWREPSGAGGQEGVAIPELNVGELQSPVPP